MARRVAPSINKLGFEGARLSTYTATFTCVPTPLALATPEASVPMRSPRSPPPLSRSRALWAAFSVRRAMFPGRVSASPVVWISHSKIRGYRAECGRSDGKFEFKRPLFGAKLNVLGTLPLGEQFQLFLSLHAYVITVASPCHL